MIRVVDSCHSLQCCSSWLPTLVSHSITGLWSPAAPLCIMVSAHITSVPSPLLGPCSVVIQTSHRAHVSAHIISNNFRFRVSNRILIVNGRVDLPAILRKQFYCNNVLFYSTFSVITVSDQTKAQNIGNYLCIDCGGE